jgi:hypothetical protein
MVCGHWGMEAIAQPELFGGLFVDLERERRRSVRSLLMELTELHGPLLPQSVIPVYLDVSKQRVSQLIEEGRWPVFKVDGKNFVPMLAIEFFREEERKSGRPVKELTFRESFRRHVSPKIKNIFEKKS